MGCPFSGVTLYLYYYESPLHNDCVGVYILFRGLDKESLAMKSVHIHVNQMVPIFMAFILEQTLTLAMQ